MPSPIETELRVQLSPVPTQTVFASDGSMAIAPMDCTACLSKTGRNVVPPSRDRHTPPLADPTNTVTLPSWPACAAIAAIRPLMVADPMLRMPRPEMTPESNGGGAGAALSGCAAARRKRRQVVRPMTGYSLAAAAADGNANRLGSAGALTSAFSRTIFWFRGWSGGPVSYEN